MHLLHSKLMIVTISTHSELNACMIHYISYRDLLDQKVTMEDVELLVTMELMESQEDPDLR